MTESRQLTIRLKNVGPHEDLTLSFQAGVNVLRGRNGVGKSAYINAAARALGGDEPVTVKDHALRGQIEVDGVCVLEVGRRVTASGAPSVELGGYSSIGAVIDPGIIDPQKADAARVRAIFKMVPVAAAPETLLELAGGEKDLVPGAATSILDAAEMIRRLANEKGLEAEREAEKEKAQSDVWRQERAGIALADGTPEQTQVARKRSREAMSALERVRLLVEERASREKANAEIAASLGQRPDVRAAETDVARRRSESEAALAEVMRLEALLDGAQRMDILSKADFHSAEERLTATKTAQKRWDEQKALLDRPITLPTAAEIPALEAAAAQAQSEVTGALAAERGAELTRLLGQSTVRFNEAFDRAAIMRGIAHSVSGRLGEVLAARGLETLEMIEGRLFIKRGDNRLLFSERLSTGERAAVALRIATKAFKGRVIPLEPEFWAALQPSARKEVDAAAEDLGVIMLTEEPTDDDTITVGRAR